ncbi:glycoside hydrolase family 27 protein [Sphingomonas sp. Leaf242]|uniref:glycoside hydrolase family 27 protein n=1 Tax=Sphingomonas sp. Leaf242 TaxID=1736304 RepID=UPI000713B74B|nr:glycoside hydrolase family 27 protein [Sphingomonas sp. Leaf242]KQO09134.1 alpha-galactosidase [Sphingomonas sp. Leaf242]
MTITRRTMLSGSAGLGLASLAPAPLAARTAGPTLAPTPPMGWNSWNSFATTITEAQAIETARIMARTLLPSGYDIFTVDIQWYEPEAKSYTYNAAPKPSLDAYGRLIPAPNRFPSSADGKGFRKLADTVHTLGLRFGVHLMRGIPRLAVERDLPILGTKTTARAIADTSSTCSWNPDMYGVDMTKPGAQAYYDSVFALFASWGVDFVKMDDMSRPYDAHAPEIEAAAAAIRKTGRPIILSLSPGETPVPRADHVARHAQMWRISDDFWDSWPMLEAQFTRLENWNAHRRIGGWPDADMLPLGRLSLGERDTKFTPDEQRTLMTLWSIARSPLIMGGDLRHLNAPTLALLTNPEVLAVNQASRDNQPHFVADDTRVWSARPTAGAGTYLALFNTGKTARDVSVDLTMLGIAGPAKVRDLWTRTDTGVAKTRITRSLPSHGAGLYRLTAA